MWFVVSGFRTTGEHDLEVDDCEVSLAEADTALGVVASGFSMV
jgi:hypothetical protein